MKEIYEYIEKDCKEWMDLQILDLKSKDNISLEDTEGYKYTTNLRVIKNARKRELNLNRFFRSNPHTVDNIKNYLNINGIQYDLITKQIDNAKSKIILYCPIHGDFTACWNTIKNGSGCPECGKELAASKTRNSYEYVEGVFKECNLQLISETYINNLKPLNFICNLHIDKGVQTTSFGNLITEKCVCIYCNKEDFTKKFRKTHEEFIGEVNNVHHNKYEVMSEYKGANKYVRIKCNNCDYVWETKATHIISGHGCPKCKSPSKGEDLIREYLQSSNVVFKEQYRIKECRYKKPLPFDFAIFDNNDNLLYLIEFDGKQHFKPTSFGGTSKKKANRNFELQQIRDNIKDDYCKINNIKLIRIPYWEIDNIETILELKLNARR